MLLLAKRSRRYWKFTCVPIIISYPYYLGCVLQLAFDQYVLVPGDAMAEEASRATDVVEKVRMQKELPPRVEDPHSLMDKL